MTPVALKRIMVCPLNELSESTLESLGLTKNPNPDYNYYQIKGTDKFCMTRNNGFLKLCTLPEFRGVKQITSTKKLVTELIGLRDGDV